MDYGAAVPRLLPAWRPCSAGWSSCAGPRGSARLGALLALAGGIWFAIGPEISQLWHAGGAQGSGHGSAHIQMLEMLTYHTGLGVVIAALAGYAFPRFPVVEEEVAAPRRGVRPRPPRAPELAHCPRAGPVSPMTKPVSR